MFALAHINIKIMSYIMFMNRADFEKYTINKDAMYIL